MATTSPTTLPRPKAPFASPSPSLKGASLKSRKSFALPSLLNIRAKPAATKLKQVNTTEPQQTFDEKFDNAVPMASRVLHDTRKNVAPTGQKPLSSRPERASPPVAIPRSKSQQIFRKISSTFHKSSNSADSTPPLPTLSVSAKQQRDDALRARGLLPPKDLSQQEMEQDRRLSIPASSSEGHSSSQETTESSAASRIKQEWEARNRSADAAQLERLTSFKYGGSNPSVNIQPTDLDPVAEVETPLPSPLVPEDKLLQGKSKRTQPPPLMFNSTKISSAGPSPTRSLPATPFDPEITACSIPLPPSPSPSELKAPQSDVDVNDIANPTSPHTIPLPPSPNSHSSPPSPPITSTFELDTPRASGTPTGVETPKQLFVQTFFSQSPASTPTISTFQQADDTSLALPARGRSNTFPPTLAESVGSSLATPSLDNSSQTNTSIHTTSTSDSAASWGKPKASSKARAGEGVGSFPMIAESPIEDVTGITASSMLEDSRLDLSLGEFGGFKKDQAALPETVRKPTRGMTLPDPSPAPLVNAVKAERRKSLNPFRRDKTDASATTKKGSSLASLRRSVVGTLSGSRNSAAPSAFPNGFNVSHLPPSPNLPTSFTAEQTAIPQSRSNPVVQPSPSLGSVSSTARNIGGNTSNRNPSSATTGVGARPTRRAISPTIHSRGSILYETSAIEDEESRRMTEMAFLG